MCLNLSNLDIETLIDLFKNTNRSSTLEEEEYKYLIIKEICFRLNKELHHPHLSSKIKDFSHEQTFKTWIFNFIAISGLFRHATSSYLYGVSLLALIPGIGAKELIICSVIYTILDSLIFFVFELSFIKTMLNLNDSKDNLTLHIQLYEKQIKVISHIEYLISTRFFNQIDKNKQDQYQKICHLFIQNILEKNKILENCKPNIYIEILKNIVLSFGMFSKIASSYFMAHALLMKISPGLTTTPIGLLFILITILANIGFFYCLGTSSISNIVNPSEEAIKKLKNSLEQFKLKNQFFTQHHSSHFNENMLENRL